MIRIPMTKGAIALIDEVDEARICQYKWHLQSSGYAARSARSDGKRRMILMHREIMNAPSGDEVDHVNGDPLDNRRSNLRLCSHYANMANKRPKSTAKSSRFKGVWRNKSAHKWQAEIRVRDERIHLGLFQSEMEAALAYDRAALEHFGEFARLNFPMLRNASA